MAIVRKAAVLLIVACFFCPPSTATPAVTSRSSLLDDSDDVHFAPSPPPPPPPPLQVEASTGVPKHDCNDSKAAHELLSRMRELQDELAATQQATERAADAKKFTEAAAHQGRGLELTAERDNIRHALVALCGDPNLLDQAADMEALVSQKWQRRLDEMTRPLEAAINTTLAIVQQSLHYAAEAGHTGIQIGEPNLYGRSYVPEVCTHCYVVSLGFCTVLVGPDLTEAQQREFYYGIQQAPSGDASSYGLPEGTELSEYLSGVTQRCSEAEAFVLASTYDATTLHSYRDYTRVLYSREARLLLQWRLHVAGYAMGFACVSPSTFWDSQNPVLAVKYGQVWSSTQYNNMGPPILQRLPRPQVVSNVPGAEVVMRWITSTTEERLRHTQAVLMSRPRTFTDFVRFLADDDINKFY